MRRSGGLALIFILLVAAGALTATLLTGTTPELGLDLQGGASVVLEPRESAGDEQLDQAIEIIRNRVDGLGVAEPEIARQGDAVIVQLPGVEDQRRALEVVGRTAVLRFRPVLAAGPPEQFALQSQLGSTTTTAPGETTTTTAAPADSTTSTSEQGLGLVDGELAAPVQETTTTTAATTTSAAETTTTTAATTTTAGEPSDDEPCGAETVTPEEDDPEVAVVMPGKDENGDGRPDACFRLGPVPVDAGGRQLDGAALSSAEALIPSNEWTVSVDFKGFGEDLFNTVAEQCFNYDALCPTRQIAITLDAVVESAPSILPNEAVFQQFTQGVSISGGANGFSEREAKDLELVLDYGALPIQLEPQTVQTVSATLGEDSLRAGLAAGIGGVVLVLLYLTLYYRGLGLVVVLGMSVWAALLYSVISSYGVTLTLAGVTGIVVSVGVTVDSYVVYFERLKDEIRAGKTIRSSVDRGFKRAFRTILAADISSFIGASLLFWLTVGPVRGFALLLGLSTLLDVVVSYFFTRPMVALLARSRFFTEARWVGVARGLGADRAERVTPAVVPGGGS
jgi:preprotein translocase subunit SecD